MTNDGPLSDLLVASDYAAEDAERQELADDIDTLLVPPGHRMVMTCMACPEQYELLDEDGKMVAYFRLRHGYFRVDAGEVFGPTVYQHEFPDGLQGMFYDSASRREHLQNGIDCAMQYVREKAVVDGES